MSAILRWNREVAIQYNFILYLYIGLANQHDKIFKGGGAMSAILRRIPEVAIQFHFILYQKIGLANHQDRI